MADGSEDCGCRDPVRCNLARRKSEALLAVGHPWRGGLVHVDNKGPMAALLAGAHRAFGRNVYGSFMQVAPHHFSATGLEHTSLSAFLAPKRVRQLYGPKAAAITDHPEEYSIDQLGKLSHVQGIDLSYLKAANDTNDLFVQAPVLSNQHVLNLLDGKEGPWTGNPLIDLGATRPVQSVTFLPLVYAAETGNGRPPAADGATAVRGAGEARSSTGGGNERGAAASLANLHNGHPSASLRRTELLQFANPPAGFRLEKAVQRSDGGYEFKWVRKTHGGDTGNAVGVDPHPPPLGTSAVNPIVAPPGVRSAPREASATPLLVDESAAASSAQSGTFCWFL
jgi:hypothetical protein